MDFQTFQDIDWRSPDDILADLRAQAERRAQTVLADVVFFGMSQSVTERLAHQLEAERTTLAELERSHAEALANRRAHQQNIETGRAELAKLPRTADWRRRASLTRLVNTAAREARRLDSTLPQLKRQLAETRRRVSGMATVLERLQVVPRPSLDELSGLTELLGQATVQQRETIEAEESTTPD